MLICKRLAKRSNIQLLKITKEKKEPRDRVGKITDLWSHARHRCRMEPFQGRIRRSTWSLPPLWNCSKIKLLKFLKIKYLKLVITEKKIVMNFDASRRHQKLIEMSLLWHTQTVHLHILVKKLLTLSQWCNKAPYVMGNGCQHLNH